MAIILPAGSRPGDEPCLAPVIDGRGRVFCCHRANLSGRHPPNSLAAVRECVAAGVPRLEIDVRFLADGAMLVFHDATLEAESTGNGPVDHLTKATAARLRYKRPGGHPIAFLEDVVDAMKDCETRLQVDLKLKRSITTVEVDAVASALAPIAPRVLFGSQAHRNLVPFAGMGFALAFDPMMELHYWPDRSRPGLLPARKGVHGFWDDSPIAHDARTEVRDYLRRRLRDFARVAPGLSELMIDMRTLLAMAERGFRAGDELHEMGLELCAWTIPDRGPEATTSVLRDLFAVGADTITTDQPATLARYVEPSSASLPPE